MKKLRIKGHTTIELKDAKTGKVEKFENDNMVTNALNYYLQDVGAFNGNPILTSDVRDNLIPNLLGGLILLDGTLTESAETIICPTGKKMVGNGSYDITADGQDGVTELGSWNATESGWQFDGTFKEVWDFSNTQANGTIRCACLTSATHGYIGEGNATSGGSKPWNAAGRKNDLSYPGTPIGINIDGGTYQPDRVVHASRTNNTITMVDEYNIVRTSGHIEEHMSETGKIKLVTHKAPIKKLDVRYGAGQEFIPTTETEVALNSNFAAALNQNNPNHYKKYGDTFVLFAGLVGVDYGQGQWGRIPANGTLHVARINADNTASYFAIPNPKGATYLDINVFSIVVSATTIGFMSYSDGYYFVNLNTPADVTIEESGTSLIDFCYPDLEVAGGAGTKIDIGARKCYPDNGWRNGSNFYKYETYLGDNRLTNLLVSDAQNNKSTALYKSQNYLATINNLAEPVVKTAEKTMKVTYVLSFDEE
ncbi:MAG: hypothetical protein IJ703_01190 [Eubacterium sp.]|nr:hypothetical protein [Eubacterium sp.]